MRRSRCGSSSAPPRSSTRIGSSPSPARTSTRASTTARATTSSTGWWRRGSRPRADHPQRRRGGPAPPGAVARRSRSGGAWSAAHGAVPRARLPADVHLRPVPARRRASGPRGAGGVGRVERDRVRELRAGRPHQPLRRLHGHRGRDHGRVPDAGLHRPMPGEHRSSSRWATRSRRRSATTTASTRCSASSSAASPAAGCRPWSGCPRCGRRPAEGPRRGGRVVGRRGPAARGRLHAGGGDARRGAPRRGTRGGALVTSPTSGRRGPTWAVRRADRSPPSASGRRTRQPGAVAHRRPARRQHVAEGVELLVSTARDTLAAAEETGAARLAAAGAELLVDTCSYISPILRRHAAQS